MGFGVPFYILWVTELFFKTSLYIKLIEGTINYLNKNKHDRILKLHVKPAGLVVKLVSHLITDQLTCRLITKAVHCAAKSGGEKFAKNVLKG